MVSWSALKTSHWRNPSSLCSSTSRKSLVDLVVEPCLFDSMESWHHWCSQTYRVPRECFVELEFLGPRVVGGILVPLVKAHDLFLSWSSAALSNTPRKGWSKEHWSPLRTPMILFHIVFGHTSRILRNAQIARIHGVGGTSGSLVQADDVVIFF